LERLMKSVGYTVPENANKARQPAKPAPAGE
jgi:hypothetical protein